MTLAHSKRKRVSADARVQVAQLTQRMEAQLATNPARMVRCLHLQQQTYIHTQRLMFTCLIFTCVPARPPLQDSQVKAVVASVFGSPARLEAALEQQADEAQLLDNFRSVASALNTWRNKCVWTAGVCFLGFCVAVFVVLPTVVAPHRQGVGLDITMCPGVEHLAAKERELCATLRMVRAWIF